MKRLVVPFCALLALPAALSLGSRQGFAALPTVQGRSPKRPAAQHAVRKPLSSAANALNDFFEREVRPVLAEHCSSCHSAATQSPMAGLRVDSRAALLKGGARGPALIPGQPEKSLLIQTLRHTGPVKMPPQSKLPEKAVRALTRWVAMGAPWPEVSRQKAVGEKQSSSPQNWGAGGAHWAFRPVKRPPVPGVKYRAWVKNPVDAFILAKLEARGLKPSSPADRRTLVRRATFDLTGLPPTPDEVDAFVNDRASGAWERVVERLLASPAYGERWGRHWLDVARYADTKGYVFFQDGRFPWAYTYRDYVIRAFNEDLPYNRFILEQLAADQLPPSEDRRALAGMGFLTVGGRFMNNPHDIVDDRIDVVTRGLMGLTVSCARCHDHKFDPVPTKDYYSLYGVFASSSEPLVLPTLAPAPKTEPYEAYDRELRAREQKLLEFVRGKHEERARAARSRVAEYILVANTFRSRPSLDDFMLLADGGDLNPVMMVRWQAYLERSRRSEDPVFALWHALADLPEQEFIAKAPAVIARLTAGRINPLLARAFTERPPKTLAEAAQRYGEVLNGVDAAWQSLLRQGTAGRPPVQMPDPSQEELRRVFYGPGAPPEVPLGHPSDLGLLPDRPSQATLQELLKALETWMISSPQAPPRAMVLEDTPVLHEPRVFIRGNPNNTGETVPRQFLSLLSGGKPQPFQRGSGRLELAQAIASPENPLTARVMVNRIWMHHFGSTLVQTPGDFGLRSEPPTHPELLDFLAAVFTAPVGSEWESGSKGEWVKKGSRTRPLIHSPTRWTGAGWSIKHIHRLLMLSSAYQQESGDRPQARRADPENALLWRMNRRRLDFEAMRDSLLAVSGALDRTLGGPPVDLLAATLPARRTVYGLVDRLTLPGLLRTFDFPSPDATNAQRDSTTVPQQALFLMNNRFAQEAAGRLLKRPEITGATGLRAKISALYRLTYSREPGEDEVTVAREFLGESPSEGSWTQYAQALLAANEFIFID